MTTDTAIDVVGLTKAYGENLVLRGIDFTVRSGTVFALLGSNGAGKTTTIRILATLLRADSGTASVNGFDVSADAKQVRRSISLTGQFAALDDVLTGRENLTLIARLRRLKSTDSIAEDMLARIGLDAAADRRVAEYSGGMRRRLDIAMSLIGDPPVLFLDEPTTGLDPQARLQTWAMIRDLADRGTTVLLTTQYLDEAEHLADQIAILHSGRIIADGSLSELRALFPPTKVEYVEKQPTLEEIFLSIVGDPPDRSSSERTGDHHDN